MSTANVLDLQPENRNDSRLPQHNNATTISRCVCSALSYNDFYWNHMQANWPVVLTGVSNNWECHKQWMRHSNTGQRASADPNTNTNMNNEQPTTAINYDYLKRKVGNCQVPVANCSKEYYNSHAKCEMHFYDYLDYWQHKTDQQDNEHVAGENCNTVQPTANTQNLYLKDWHLKAQMPDYNFYTVPKHFASDWLNEYLIDNGKDDYRFVYMGPKDTWTPFHADVFGSYSWSTNIVGCKRWLLLPPGEENKLKDRLGNLPVRIDEHLLSKEHVRFFIINQTENESIFVPSGWYHQVYNSTDTISVNHNWFNACNLQHIWQNLAISMQQVRAEIEDCRQMDNFEDHCQTMLRASFGINFFDFLNMLEYIAEKRLKCDALQNNNNDQMPMDATVVGTETTKYLLFDTFTMNDYHMHHDLHSIHGVVQEMLHNSVVCESRAVLYKRCLCLEKITNDF